MHNPPSPKAAGRTACVLDLDLDFFLNHYETDQPADADTRLDNRFEPWPATQVRAYLEGRCGLSTSSPTPGKRVRRHDQVFHSWQHLIARGSLAVPFDVVHIDAHADLGEGDSVWMYLCGDFFDIEPGDRPSACRHKLNEGNYLLFAIACGWVRSLTYVMHPERTEPDVTSLYLRDLGDGDLSIQIRRWPEEVMEVPLSNAYLTADPIDSLGCVPLELLDCEDFRATRPFDFVFLAESPSFTPLTSDALIPVIDEYIETRVNDT